jgi:hypothetical protein
LRPLAAAIAGVLVAGWAFAAAAAPTDLQALRGQVADLEQRVGRAEDIEAIKKLQRAYGYYLDKGMGDEMAKLFAEDATAEYAGGVLVGREHIRKGLQLLGPGGRLPEGRLNDHILLQPVIDIDRSCPGDGGEAHARWRAFIMAGNYGKAGNWGEGPYENTYVKQDGAWRIKTLHWYRTFIVPYDGGWARRRDDADSGSVSGTPATDLPPSDPNQKAFPAAYTPPFHYQDGEGAAPPATAPCDVGLANATAAELTARLADLSRRERQLEDRAAIENLQDAYGFYADKKLWGEVADLFADDATVEVGGGGVYVGKAHIRRYLDSLGAGGLKYGELANQIQLSPVIDVAADGRSAEGRWLLVGESGQYGKSAEWSGGVYENRYVKQGGAWKIKALHLYLTFASPYADGWGKTALNAFPGQGHAPAPDRPPSVAYQPYPAYFVPPFHYDNPGLAAAAAPLLEPVAAESAARMAAKATSEARRIGAIEDREAVERLQNVYGYYADKELWRDAANLFAADGSVEIGGRGVYIGRARIHDALSTIGPEGLPAGQLSNHVQVQPVIHVAADGRTAKLRSRAILQAGTYGGTGRLGDGVYEDTFVKQDGVWKIRSMHFYFGMITDYDLGWGKNAGANPGPSAARPPDRPPTVIYRTYPTPFTPPFDYPNPVSGR